MARILVLGGASATGSHLCDRLLRRGYEVVAIDDLSTGSFANLAHLKREPRFVFREHDVVEPFDEDVDGIFHLALPSTRARCEGDSVRAAHTCVVGTLHALDVARARRASLVFVTSTERYGMGIRCAESIANDYASTHGIDVRVLRLPSSYGPRMPPVHEHPVSSLVISALQGIAVSDASSDGDASLRLVFVEDAVETLVRTMGCPVRPPPISGPSVDTTMAELRAIVAVAAGQTTLLRSPDRPSRAASTLPWLRPSPSVEGALPAALVLGPTPSTSLSRGIRRTLRWFATRMGRLDGLPPVSSSDTLGKVCELGTPTIESP